LKTRWGLTQSQSPVFEITDPLECEKKPRKTAKKKVRHGVNPNSSSRARSGCNAEKSPDEDRVQSTQAAESSKDQSGIRKLTIFSVMQKFTY
jgi:hypothetical protein